LIDLLRGKELTTKAIVTKRQIIGIDSQTTAKVDLIFPNWSDKINKLTFASKSKYLDI